MTLTALFMCVLSAGAYDFSSGGFYFDITSSNTVSLTHRSQYSSDYSGDVIVPSTVTYGGVTYTVTSLGNNSFYDCEGLTSVTLPTTITTIDESAFYYCTALTQVVIPESVIEIGSWNFYMSNELTEVILPSTLNSMGEQCFSTCTKLTKVTCRATTPPTIGQYCFSSSSAKTLYVPESAISAYQAEYNWRTWFSSIEAMPEYDLSYMNLKFVITSATTAKCVGCMLSSPSGTWNIPDKVGNYRVTEVGRDAFFNCGEITTVKMGANVEVIEPYAFYLCSGMTTLNLGHVTTIGNAAFGDCFELAQVTIPNSVTYIGDYGFGGCGLTSVTIPATVELIEDKAFHNCPYLSNINVDSNNPNYSSTNGVLFNKDMTKLISYPIGKSITGYTIPESVTSLGDGAFGYSHLQRVTLPSRLTEVPYLTFAYNDDLTNVTCLAATPPVVGLAAFESTIENSGIVLNVPKGCKSAYQEADGWRDFPEIHETYYDFKYGYFYYNITSDSTVEVTCENDNYGTYQDYVMMTIPPSVYYNDKYYTVTAIGDYAFKDCSNIETLVLPSTITRFGYCAFYNCTRLSSINMPENLQSIDTYAFYHCRQLGNVKIPATVTWIGTYAFCACSSLTEFSIPSNVTSIAYGTFYDCTNLATVSIGSSVQNIANMAFYHCSSLTKIICNASTPPNCQSTTFDDSHYSSVQLFVPQNSLNAYKSANYWKNFTNITGMACDFEQDGIFYNITGTNPATVEVTYMTSDYNSYSGVVNIPETVMHEGVTYTVTAIGNNAFRQSESMTAVTIPNTVTTIGDYAFYRCKGLTHIEIPNSVTTINYAAFWICLNLTEVIIPNSVTTLGSMSFRNCTALTRVVIGKNVHSIGSTSFWFCPNITEVICLAETPPTLTESSSETTFTTAIYSTAVLHVPYGSHEAYRNHANWGRFANIVSEQVVNPVMTGDVNGDSNVNVADVTMLINIVLSGNASASSNPAADVNNDGYLNISDVTMLINMVLGGYTGGPVGAPHVNYLINNVPFTMVRVDGGTFTMGDASYSLSRPLHEVTVSDFCIGETEVTQALWQTIMGSNPSYNQSNANLPAENMDWDDCQEFTAELSRLTGQNFRLPTEAEWEFAARGGNKSQGYTYAGSNTLGDVAWHQGNSSDKTHVVATKAPNELGLYDMSGNVFEWCQDYFGNYTSEAQFNPQGPATGEYRICRGSSYCRDTSGFDWFRCGSRTYDSPTNPAEDTGLRLACVTNGEQLDTRGISVKDHLFVRMDGVDNEVTIEESYPVHVMFWLDDDEIYTNSSVQALTPQAHNDQGDLYNEITYNSMQFNLYLPTNLEIVTDEDGLLDIKQGYRMPHTAKIFSTLNNETKIIDGTVYRRYSILVYNVTGYGTHFSGYWPERYASTGPLKKDDAALLDINIRRIPGIEAPAGNQEIIIANTIFSIQEVVDANWPSNQRQFIYGNGTIDETQRFMHYVRVKVK